MRSSLIQFVVVLVVAVVGYGAWSNRADLPLIGGMFAEGTSGGDAPARPPTGVDVAAARSGSVIVSLEALGNVRANEAVTVSSQVMGVIDELSFTEGQRVEKGAILVKLDSAIQSAEVEVRQAQVQVRRAELENAVQIFDRARQLIKTQNIPQARVDELATALKAARASVTVAEAGLRSARARLAKQTITAPFSGRVGIRHVSPGTLIEPGDPIITLDDISVVKLDFQVPERNLADITIGQEIATSTDAYPGKMFFGNVVSIDTRIDTITRAVSVRASLANPDEALKPGMFMLVELGIETRDNAVLIPEEAVIADGTARFVFVAVDGKAVRRPVELGQRAPGEVEVLSGVTAGEQVVVGGIQKIRDGAPVKPRETEAQADAS